MPHQRDVRGIASSEKPNRSMKRTMHSRERYRPGSPGRRVVLTPKAYQAGLLATGFAGNHLATDSFRGLVNASYWSSQRTSRGHRRQSVLAVTVR